MYLTDFKTTIINTYKELKENIVLVKRWKRNLIRKMKLLKTSKKDPIAETYNKTNVLNELSSRQRAEESLNLKIN